MRRDIRGQTVFYLGIEDEQNNSGEIRSRNIARLLGYILRSTNPHVVSLSRQFVFFDTNLQTRQNLGSQIQNPSENCPGYNLKP